MSSLLESKVAELMFGKKCSKFCVVFVAFFSAKPQIERVLVKM